MIPFLLHRMQKYSQFPLWGIFAYAAKTKITQCLKISFKQHFEKLICVLFANHLKCSKAIRLRSIQVSNQQVFFKSVLPWICKISAGIHPPSPLICKYNTGRKSIHLKCILYMWFMHILHLSSISIIQGTHNCYKLYVVCIPIVGVVFKYMLIIQGVSKKSTHFGFANISAFKTS